MADPNHRLPQPSDFTLAERMQNPPTTAMTDKPAVPADLLADVIPRTRLYLPAITEGMSDDVKARAAAMAALIEAVETKRESARAAATAADEMTVSDLIAGEAHKVVAAVVDAIEAEGDLRDTLAEFAPTLTAEYRRLSTEAHAAEARAREAITSKLEALGYSRTPGERGFFQFFQGAVIAHPDVRDAAGRADNALSLMNAVDPYLEENRRAVAALRLALAEARRRAVAV